jgi:hypothetical protein
MKRKRGDVQEKASPEKEPISSIFYPTTRPLTMQKQTNKKTQHSWSAV